MKTLGEVLKLSADFLQGKQVCRARRQAEELLAHLLKISRIDLYMQYDRPMEEKELEVYRDYIRRCSKREPWQYIVGEVEFYHCTIHVSSDVLIPRQETEILASQIVEKIPDTPLTVWDICCGSGCLGLALKKARPGWTVVCSDISHKALEIARSNALKNEVDIEFLEGDLLCPFEGKKADLIVCNPPYVAEQEYAGLDQEVRDFEPKLALVSGPTGLEFYERLAQELPSYLRPGAKVFFEVGTGMGGNVKKVFCIPPWRNGAVAQDWAGHDRFFSVEIE